MKKGRLCDSRIDTKWISLKPKLSECLLVWISLMQVVFNSPLFEKTNGLQLSIVMFLKGAAVLTTSLAP